MEETAKATISIGNATMTFEGSQKFVDEQVARYIGCYDSSDRGSHTDNIRQSPDVTEDTAASERQLVLAKKPKGHAQTVAVLAFSLAQAGVAEFTEEDMRKAYIRARVRPPKVVGQAIRDAKNNFDYVDSGSKRGTYKLTNHGDRTVRFDLPRTKGGVKE